ncbi:MAG: metallophosphoesterase family protein [Flavobacteriaceae bacterium]|nr:metallophosphoesterase family protein [Flavobacteriaceae bacterium]
MNYFIVGDIHGCYYTMRQLIDNHWDMSKEKLVILGDMVNKGKHTFAVLEYLLNLQEKFAEKVLILKGNNEFLFERYYRDPKSITLSVKQKFENYNLDYLQVLDWMEDLPHFYENGKVFFSHAGIGIDSYPPVSQKEINILFNNQELKNIDKMQFIGHSVVDEPTYDSRANAWFLDTGAGYGKKLTAARTDSDGNVINMIQLDVSHKDICKFN